jgi:dTDP-4-amino-4,6-dideoxygalactose transaminase
VSASSPIPINDPKRAFEELREETERAVLEVLASGQYILGPAAEAFEREAAAYLGVPHGVGVSSGTEALLTALQELGVGPGDEVIVPAFTFVATATVAARLGATPVFVDIDLETYQMDPAGLERALGPKTKAVIAVHLYGYPAPLGDYLRRAERAGAAPRLIEDAAQAIGTRCHRPGGAGAPGARGTVLAGTIGDWGCFSFYPTKNLPACGEAGLMVTADPERAERARQLRSHGQDAPYRHSFLAGNGRLDGIQAAILRVRLARVDEWNRRRRTSAARYGELFRASGLLERADIVLPPEPAAPETTNHHQYTIRSPDRDALVRHLSERGIGAGVYYPIALPFQPIFRHLGHRQGEFPRAERAAREVLSLPIHQFLPEGAVEHVVEAIAEHYR